MNKYWNVWDYQSDWVERCVGLLDEHGNIRLCMDVLTEAEARDRCGEAIDGGLGAKYSSHVGTGCQPPNFFTIHLDPTPPNE